MRVYATVDDVKSYDDTLTLTPAQLRDASARVEEMTRGAYYAVDSTGMPTNTRIRDAFRDATIAQAADTATATNYATGAKALPVKSATIGNASYTMDTSLAAAATTVIGPDGMSLTAERILKNAGVLPITVWAVG